MEGGLRKVNVWIWEMWIWKVEIGEPQGHRERGDMLCRLPSLTLYFRSPHSNLPPLQPWTGVYTWQPLGRTRDWTKWVWYIQAVGTSGIADKDQVTGRWLVSCVATWRWHRSSLCLFYSNHPLGSTFCLGDEGACEHPALLKREARHKGQCTQD